jgi:peptide-methionine (S)-S-oxide reductase
MTEKAAFAAGCFWGVEHAFRQIEGVVETQVGYTGGSTPEPSYKQVCRGRTGHAEAVEVLFDPERVSYAQLLAAFFAMHNPTTRNRQGLDIGSQYRSAVFVHSPEQRRVAEDAREAAQTRARRPVVTEIVPAGPFWPAEEYHQRYAEKHGRAVCPVPPPPPLEPAAEGSPAPRRGLLARFMG